MAISVNNNITTTSNYVIINYICDDKITKIELTKDGTNFIEAKSFNQSSATFLISDWDNGTYPNCYLRATIAEVPVIILSGINNITVNRGEEFYIRYNTNIPAVKHEFSWNNGNTYLNKTNEIITENNTNYKYLHQAETDYDNLNINIRVTDANNNTSTKSFVVTFTGSAAVEYTITKNLTNCSLSNSSTSITSGSNYEAMIVCDNNYTLSSVTVTIGGIDVTNGVVSNGKISISNVEGDIIITAIATAITVVPTTYTITRNLSNCTSNNTTSSVNQGVSYSAIITPNSGYELSNVAITMGGTNVTSSVYTYQNGNAVINIPSVTGDIVITVTASVSTPTTYTITRYLSDSTINNTSNTVNKNESYNATISANSGYEIESIVVTMGGTDITYEVVNGNNISIPNVTGDIVIIATATAVQITYSITNNLSNCTTNNSSTTINKNESYNATISANSGYEIESIVVTMGGTDITSQVVSGNSINIASVTGDVVIMVSTTAVQTTYSITNNLSHCTTNNSSTVINKNESYNATISANSGYEIESIVVKMGGTNITSSAVSGKRINIPNVTGDIVIIATANKIESGEELKDFPYADELIEIAMTYWRNADNEYVSGTSWSQGTTYRSANTPLSYSCEAEQDVENSFWVKKGTRHYKAIDCSTLVGMSLRGYTYENGPYANKTKFNAFRTDRNQTNPAISWAFAVPRSAAEIGEFCYNKKWIVPLDTIGNASNNFSGLKKGDLIFWAKKTDDGSYKQPDRYMKISHVAIVYGNSSTFNNRLSVIESTDNTNKVHTLSDGSTVNCGVRIKDLAHNKADQIVLVARIQV